MCVCGGKPGKARVLGLDKVGSLRHARCGRARCYVIEILFGCGYVMGTGGYDHLGL